ncbi:MAG: PEP-CTERM sorting domain-containing protein [Opitutaceae bacterium]|nr:PEP-CTERM sorting domain-containing protein [Opitutaceae bacterium]
MQCPCDRRRTTIPLLRDRLALAKAQAVLNFDNLTLPNYGIVPAGYGSTLDPHLASVGYRTFNGATNVTYSNDVEFWNADYGDLTKVIYASNNGYAAELTLVPAAGYGIRLLSFDMAGYSHQDRTNSTMRLTDANGNVLFDYAAAGPVLIQGDSNGPLHSTFTPNFLQPGALSLQWGNDWNIGLDNIQFQVVALNGVPEPATGSLLGFGAVALAWLARRRGTRG